jgi:hypothetical protein
MDTDGLSDFVQGYRIAQALKRFDGPLAFPFLLSRRQALVPLLVIEGPLSEEMVHDHQDFVSDRHCCFLAPKARFQAPEGTTQKGRRFACGPGTLHQDPPQVPIDSVG